MSLSQKDLTTAVEHLTGILKATGSLDAKHTRLHKVHDALHDAHMAHVAAHTVAKASGRVTADLDKAHLAHKAAHESARLARVDHAVGHKECCAKISDHVRKLVKVLGGGPEVASATDGPIGLPSRLSTSDAAEANKVQKSNRTSPFDRIAKSGQSAPRHFVNAHNPMYTG